MYLNQLAPHLQTQLQVLPSLKPSLNQLPPHLQTHLQDCLTKDSYNIKHNT